MSSGASLATRKRCLGGFEDLCARRRRRGLRALAAIGHLTEASQQGLHRLIRQARALAPDGAISVDLPYVGNVEDNAVERLRWVIDRRDDSGPATGAVDAPVPHQVSHHESGTAPTAAAAAWPETHTTPPGARMRETTPMETHDPTGPVPVPDPAPATAGGTGLEPSENFPADVADLPLAELQVLHSKLSRQLDHETLTNPAGPHPITQDRHQGAVAELDNRATTGPA